MESADNQEKSIPEVKPVGDRDQSLSKIETIALLNDSIDRLEQTIKGLSDNSAPVPSSDSINTLLTTTQELADTVVPSTTVSSETTTEPTSASKIEMTSDPAAASKEVSSKAQTDTKPASSKPVTPGRKKFYLPLIIVGIIAIALAAVYWLWLPRQEGSFSLLPPSTTTEVIEDLESNGDRQISETPLINDSHQPDLIIEPAPTTNPQTQIEEPIEAPIEIPIPADLESPGKVKNLKIVTIEPKLSFTPEQTLISALKTKVAQLPQDYPAELIDSLKVDLAHNSLQVNLSDQWYQLDESSQDAIANQMLQRSRVFSFEQLQLKDPADILVARNPVIGQEIVILEREKTNSEQQSIIDSPKND
ncbi:MAG: hypothetical protein AAGE84_02890 [Cyanobacteria bacterium P01_G01_bin.39]